MAYIDGYEIYRNTETGGAFILSFVPYNRMMRFMLRYVEKGKGANKIANAPLNAVNMQEILALLTTVAKDASDVKYSYELQRRENDAMIHYGNIMVAKRAGMVYIGYQSLEADGQPTYMVPLVDKDWPIEVLEDGASASTGDTNVHAMNSYIDGLRAYIDRHPELVAGKGSSLWLNNDNGGSVKIAVTKKYIIFTATEGDTELAAVMIKGHYISMISTALEGAVMNTGKKYAVRMSRKDDGGALVHAGTVEFQVTGASTLTIGIEQDGKPKVTTEIKPRIGKLSRDGEVDHDGNRVLIAIVKAIRSYGTTYPIEGGAVEVLKKAPVEVPTSTEW